MNEAAYYWASGDDATEGYYYDQEHLHKVVPQVDAHLPPKVHKRDSTGYFVSYIPPGANVKAQTWTLRAVPTMWALCNRIVLSPEILWRNTNPRATTEAISCSSTT